MPFTALYWSFLERNEEKFVHIQRMRMPLNAMRARDADARERLRERVVQEIRQLERGEVVS